MFPISVPAAATTDSYVLDPARLRRCKAAYTTRAVPLESLPQPVGLTRDTVPRPGGLVLARVEEVGHHTRLELPEGRRATLFAGDEIVVAYGSRYAPDQFEAYVPADVGECHLVAAGGLAARAVSQHQGMRPPTRLTPLGLLADGQGRVVNTADYASQPATGTPVAARPLTVAVVGTSMNAGKTTTAASLVRGLSRAGYTVGAAKVTGTGAGGDRWLLRDAGAERVLDFTDAGYVSTYQLAPPAVLGVMRSLVGSLASGGAQAIVVEVADGLLQSETAALVADPGFAELTDGVIFAAGDALSAVAGTARLRRLGVEPCAVSGLLTASPLAAREARGQVDLPVVEPHELCEPVTACRLTATMSPAAGSGNLDGTAAGAGGPGELAVEAAVSAAPGAMEAVA